MIWWAGSTIVQQWTEFRRSGARVELRALPLVTSAAIVLVAYAVLIETWRRTVRAWGARMGWSDATRIWMISNLGRYIPGKVWQIGAMGYMARAVGVSPLVATGSSLVINLVNLLAGFGVVFVTGTSVLGNPALTATVALLLVVGMVATPWLTPWLGKLAGTVLGRPIVVPRLPHSALWVAAIGCVVAWLLYGIAFELLVIAVLGEAPGPTTSYVAAFTGSYLLGYIAIFTPGGLAVREQSLVGLLGRLALAGGGAAGVIALASRLWLTVLEVIPGAVLLAHQTLRRRRSSTPTHATNV